MTPVEVGNQTVPVNPAVATPVPPVKPARAKPSVIARDKLERKRERKMPAPVGKLRKGTTIMMDEAAYDPSLRFVLVAIVLFVLFLVLLLLSKWIG